MPILGGGAGVRTNPRQITKYQDQTPLNPSQMLSDTAVMWPEAIQDGASFHQREAKLFLHQLLIYAVYEKTSKN